MALTSTNEIIFVKQYRLGPSKILLELLDGFIKKNESSEEAAFR